MRLELQALELSQDKSTNVYLTKLSVKQIRELIESKQVVPDTYNPDIKAHEGYQRDLNPTRMKKIHNFLEGHYKTVLPVLPTSVVLSVRKSNSEPLKYKDNKLIIGDDAVIHLVDGQHRIYGIKEHKDMGYEIPVTIIYGMNSHQEAAQFLVINSTQKKVDPSLQLRVLFNAKEELLSKFIEEVKNVIPWQAWKIEALRIGMELEKNSESPWYNNVEIPNDSSEEWKPIKEGSFIDSLRYLASEENPIASLDPDTKIRYLINYWKTIKKLWPRAFEKYHIGDYALVAPLGAGIFNTLFPSVIALKQAQDRDLEEILTTISEEYPINDWRKRNGKLTRRGGSQGVYRQVAEEFIKTIYPKLDYINEKEYEKLRHDNFRNRWLLDKAHSMLNPIGLKYSDNLGSDRGKYKKACYVLVNLKEDGKVKVYVGKSKTIEGRLKGHNKDYNLYHVSSCKDEKEEDQLEGTLYHLVKAEVNDNGNHPNKKYCLFCKS